MAAPAVAGPASDLTFTVRITQGPTFRHAKPPDGDAGDVFSTVLTIFTIGQQFEKADNARVGMMTFSYVLHGSCSSAGGGCKGTADITTLTKLPGGTINANGTAIPLRTPFVIPVKGGTGRYAGARGTVLVAPDGQPRSTYRLRLP